MLELRPNCEYCDRDLPPDALDARICTYECTFCAECVEHVLHDVCPNCGGGFAQRPIRPRTARRSGGDFFTRAFFAGLPDGIFGIGRSTKSMIDTSVFARHCRLLRPTGIFTTPASGS